MNSTASSEQPLKKLGKAALSRWKLETLTGLLGIRSLQNHQAETERNVAAENASVRKSLWGEPPGTKAAEGEDMHTQTILGDVTHPTPIVINGQQSSAGGVAKVLAGLAIGSLIPTAGIGGFALSKLLQATTRIAESPAAEPKQFTDDSLDIGLLRFEDLDVKK